MSASGWLDLYWLPLTEPNMLESDAPRPQYVLYAGNTYSLASAVSVEDDNPKE